MMVIGRIRLIGLIGLIGLIAGLMVVGERLMVRPLVGAEAVAKLAQRGGFLRLLE
jgi:hypothetical protein